MYFLDVCLRIFGGISSAELEMVSESKNCRISPTDALLRIRFRTPGAVRVLSLRIVSINCRSKLRSCSRDWIFRLKATRRRPSVSKSSSHFVSALRHGSHGTPPTHLNLGQDTCYIAKWDRHEEHTLDLRLRHAEQALLAFFTSFGVLASGFSDSRGSSASWGRIALFEFRAVISR